MMADLDKQISRLKLENDIKAEKLRDSAMADAVEKNAIDLELKRLDLKERQLKIDKLVMDSRADKLNSDLAIRSASSRLSVAVITWMNPSIAYHPHPDPSPVKGEGFFDFLRVHQG